VQAPVSSIKVVGKTYQIQERELLDGNCFGFHNAKELTIQYIPQAEGQLKDTLLHESLHALSYAIKLDLSENQVHGLAAVLIPYLKDNKAFIEWLMHSEV